MALRFLVIACAAALLFSPGAGAAERVTVPGGVIMVELTSDSSTLDRAALMHWVRDSATAVASYYGHFPVSTTRLVVTPRPGSGVAGGRSWAENGGLIRVRVGESSTPADFAQDWVLVHEMTHLALPSLPDEQEWLEEGLATYVEPLARAQSGRLSDEDVWSGIVDGMPKGLPREGDRGLDRTHTWGRTYWGGALFCLLADLEIRRRTHNAQGLQDALRAILASGNMETSSEIGPVLATGDRAVGVPVLEELYAREKDGPETIDLDALWRRLGIIQAGRTVRFDDDAPEAPIRRSMTARRTITP